MTTSISVSCEVREWVTFCTFPGCPNVIRTPTGKKVREHCAEHADVVDQLVFLSDNLSQFDQRLRFPLVRRGWMGVA